MNKQKQKQQAFNSYYGSVFRKCEMIIIIMRKRRRCRSISDINYALTIHAHTSPRRLKYVASTEFARFFLPHLSHTHTRNYFKSFPDTLFCDISTICGRTYTYMCLESIPTIRTEALFFLRKYLSAEFSPRKRNSKRMYSHCYCEFPFVQQHKQGREKNTFY